MTLRGDVQRLGEALAAFAIAPLPESVKRNGALAPFVTPAAHVASGMAEIVLSAGLFINGMIAYVQAFSAGPGLAYLMSRPSLTHGDFFGIGALAYLSYLVRPTSLLLAYCLGEGIARTLHAALWEGTAGIALLAVPWRVAGQFRRAGRRARIAVLVGPPRPDEVVPPERSRSRLLEVYSTADKPWSEYQVVEHEGRFYQLATRRLVRHGAHHAWRYQLHPLEEREVLRGAIVRLTPDAAPEPATPQQPGAATGTP